MVIVVIDSRYRAGLSGESFSSFTYRPHIGGWKGITKVRLVSSSVPLSGYAFRSGISTDFLVDEGGGVTKTVSLPAGNQQSDTFGATLGTLITGPPLAGTYTASFSDVTGKLTITSTVSHKITWTHPELAYIFGFLPADSSTSALSHTGSFGFNLAPPSYVYLRIDGLTGTCDSLDSHHMSYSFPLATSSNSSFWLPESLSIELPSSKEFPSSFRVSLLRANGELYDLISDWSVVLSLE